MQTLTLPFTLGRTWRNWNRRAALSDLPGLRSAAYVVPPPTSQLIGSSQAQPFTLQLAPGSYVMGMSGTSAQPEGFSLKVIDTATAAPFFSNWINFRTITQPAAEFGITAPMVLLSEPRLILAPASLGIQIRNLSPNANAIEIVFHIAEPA